MTTPHLDLSLTLLSKRKIKKLFDGCLVLLLMHSMLKRIPAVQNCHEDLDCVPLCGSLLFLSRHQIFSSQHSVYNFFTDGPYSIGMTDDDQMEIEGVHVMAFIFLRTIAHQC